jgi:hypothetical protein
VTETEATFTPALLAARGGRRPQRLVRVHTQHQVDAALEVEAELQRLAAQPRSRRQVVAVGEDGIDAEQEENDEDADDRENFPADVLHD